MDEGARLLAPEDDELDAYTRLKREIEKSLRHILESEAENPDSCDLYFTLNSPKNNGKYSLEKKKEKELRYFWMAT